MSRLTVISTIGKKRLTRSLLLSFACASLLQPLAFAENGTFSEDFYSRNDVLFYDPSACGGSSSGSGSSGPVSGTAIYAVDNEKPAGKMFHPGAHGGLNPNGDARDPYTYPGGDSINGIKEAIKRGYKQIDQDTRMSKDGVPILLHNGTPASEGFQGPGANKDVSDLTLEQIKQLTNHGVHIATLEEVLSYIKEQGSDIRVQVEWKPRHVITEQEISTIANLFNKYGVKGAFKGGAKWQPIADSLTVAQKHGFWVRSTKDDGNGWVAEVWHAPSATANSGLTGVSGVGLDCSCQADGSAAQLLQGSDNEEKAWNFLTSKGLRPEQAAGIMGNISIESHFDPKASNNGNYMGISQWDTAGRWAKYTTWAKSQGLDVDSFDAQMQYTYKEGEDRGNIKGIKKYNDVAHTAWYWGRYFEVAIINGSHSETPLTNVQSLKERTDEAQRLLVKYGGTTGTPLGDSSTPAGSSCGEGGSLANAVCSNVNAKPPEDYGIVKFPGTNEKTDQRTLYMVNLANDCLKQQGEKPITVVQGSYCSGSCAGASGSSHDKGATLDIRTRDRGGKEKIMLLLKVLREVGFAAWYRDGGDNPSFAGNEHIHAVALGAPLSGPNAPGSPDQLILYCTGGDGLKGGQKDRQLAVVGRPLPDWALNVKPACTRYPK